MNDSQKVSAFRRNKIIGGVISFIVSIIFWGLLIAWIARSPSYKPGEWLAYWVISALLFAFAGGLTGYGFFLFRIAINKPKQSTPQEIANWTFSRILHRLGGDAEFGPPWPLLFDVMYFDQSHKPESIKSDLRKWWHELYEYLQATLGARINAKDINYLVCKTCGRPRLSIQMFQSQMQDTALANNLRAQDHNELIYLNCSKCGSLLCSKCIELGSGTIKCSACGSFFEGTIIVSGVGRFGSLDFVIKSINTTLKNDQTADVDIIVDCYCTFKNIGTTMDTLLFKTHPVREPNGWVLPAAIPIVTLSGNPLKLSDKL